jgi:hypothetical protein
LVWLRLLEKDVHTPIEEGGRKNLRNTMFCEKNNKSGA